MDGVIAMVVVMDFVRHMFFEAEDASMLVLPRESAEDRRVLYSPNSRHFFFCESAEGEAGGTPQYSGSTLNGIVAMVCEPSNDIEARMTYSVGTDSVWFNGLHYLRNQEYDPDYAVVYEYTGRHLLELVRTAPRGLIGPLP